MKLKSGISSRTFRREGYNRRDNARIIGIAEKRCEGKMAGVTSKSTAKALSKKLELKLGRQLSYCP